MNAVCEHIRTCNKHDFDKATQFYLDLHEEWELAYYDSDEQGYELHFYEAV